MTASTETAEPSTPTQRILGERASPEGTASLQQPHPRRCRSLSTFLLPAEHGDPGGGSGGRPPRREGRAPRSGPGRRQAEHDLAAAPRNLALTPHLGELPGQRRGSRAGSDALGRPKERGLAHLPRRRLDTPPSQHPRGVRPRPAAQGRGLGTGERPGRAHAADFPQIVSLASPRFPRGRRGRSARRFTKPRRDPDRPPSPRGRRLRAAATPPPPATPAACAGQPRARRGPGCPRLPPPPRTR